MTPERRLRLQERIKRNVFVCPVTGCWRWLARKTKAHYPLITMRVPGYKTPRTLIATRVSLEVFKEPAPEGMEAAHDPCSCPWPDCVNPDHLRWATRRENEADKRHPERIRLRQLFDPKHRLLEEPEIPF